MKREQQKKIQSKPKELCEIKKINRNSKKIKW